MASTQAVRILKLLELHSDTNYLVFDNQGRLPSKIGYEIGRNPSIGKFLMDEEMAQTRNNEKNVVQGPNGETERITPERYNEILMSEYGHLPSSVPSPEM